MRQHILIETKNYRLEAVEGDIDWPYFLYNKDGEGMSLSSKDLDYILDEYFTKDLDCVLDEYFKEHF